MPLWFTLGLVVGAGLCALVAWRWSRRALLRVRRAERRARDAQRMAEIGALTGGLAHEIKNPLSTIGLNAQLLAEAIEDAALDTREKARLLTRVGALRREAERLRDTLADFLEFAGQIRLEPRPVDVNELVGELADFFAPEAARHGVRIRVDAGRVHSAPIQAEIDPRLVKQALLNLMLNATQAMGEPVSGRAGHDPGAVPEPPRMREIFLRTQAVRDADLGPAVAIQVADTGPGIPLELRERIFDPYFTTKQGGTGLGLPTTRRIVEEHAGRVDLYSEPGKGTEFTLLFPVSRAQRAEGAPR